MTDIVDADRVATDPDRYALVDVREPWEYDGIGHLPGAVNVPFDSFRAPEHAAEASEGAADEGGTDEDANESEGGGAAGGMLPGTDVWAELLSEAGIEADEEIVAYDDTHGVFAARFLVTAELYGHDPDRLHLLDGDFSAWQRDHEVASGPVEPAPTDYVVEPPAETPLIDADAVAAAADDPEAVVVDTREDREYEEGHIPGAVLLDWRDLVDEETRGVLDREAALDVLADRGIVPEKRIVLYCNTARRISHTYVVLRHLGFENLAFYEGSLTEWEALGRPLERGT